MGVRVDRDFVVVVVMRRRTVFTGVVVVVVMGSCCRRRFGWIGAAADRVKIRMDAVTGCQHRQVGGGWI